MTIARGFDRRTVLFGAAAAAAAIAAPVVAGGRAFAATAAEANRKVNLSGRQRMLTQRMSRAAVFASLGVEEQRHVALLEASRAEFAASLDGLRRGDELLGLPEEEFRSIRAQIGAVEDLWYPFELRVLHIVDRGAARPREVDLIARTNLPLLRASNTLVEMLVGTYGGTATDMGRAVALNVAGRQRMLSQKMTKECGLIAYGWRPEETTEALHHSIALFEDSLAALIEGNPVFELPQPPAEVRRQLDVVSGLWDDFRPVVRAAAARGRIETAQLRGIARAADPLLAQIDEAVSLYEVAPV